MDEEDREEDRTSDMIDAATIGDTVEMLRCFMEPHNSEHAWDSTITWTAALNGHTETMLAAVAHGCPWSPDTTSEAARFGRAETMLAAVEHGCPWSEYTTASAAWNGHTETMLAAVEHGCPWSVHTAASAARNGHTQTMLTAVEHGCPWSQHTTCDAALNGHIQTMLTAVEHGCHWSPHTTAFATFGGHTETMLTAVEHGCPWAPETASYAAGSHYTDTILAVLDNDAPPDPGMWRGDAVFSFPEASLFPSMMVIRGNDAPRLHLYRAWYSPVKMRAVLRVVMFISRWMWCSPHGRLRDVAFAKVLRQIRAGEQSLKAASDVVDMAAGDRLKAIFGPLK